MLVWSHEIVFRGGWRRHSVLQWCNVRAHKRITSACTIDFWPALTYQSTSADLRQQCLTSFCAVWCIILLQKGKHCGVFRGEGCNTYDTYLFPLVCLYATFCNQTWYCGAPPRAGMSCEKMGFYLQGQGVGLCDQYMMVSTTSFISFQRVFCNQTQFECRSL